MNAGDMISQSHQDPFVGIDILQTDLVHESAFPFHQNNKKIKTIS